MKSDILSSIKEAHNAYLNNAEDYKKVKKNVRNQETDYSRPEDLLDADEEQSNCIQSAAVITSL